MSDLMTIYQRLSDIAQNIGGIAKTRSNQGSFGSKYRSIDDLKNSLQPELAAFGVVMSTERISLSETTFIDIDKYGKERLNWRTLATIRVHFTCESGGVFSDHIIAKNHAGDFGPKAATSTAISQAIETVFCITAEQTETQAPAAQPRPQQQGKKAPSAKNKQKPPATEKAPLTANPFSKWGISAEEAASIGERIAKAGKRADLDKIWKEFPKLQDAAPFVAVMKKRTAEVSMPPVLQDKQVKTN